MNDDDSSSSKLQLCLTWNSFTDNIINSLETSYGDGDFVDVTLACEGESIKAHKLVLSACSQYLKRLLKENPCPHPIVILNDIGLAELKDLLVYMYHGEVKVEQDRIAKLLHTAQILEIRGLQDINQKLDQDSENGRPEASDAGQDDYARNHSEVSNSSISATNKTSNTMQTSCSLKLPPAKKPRPVPMLQCIQQSGKADGSTVVRVETDCGEDESNNSSIVPEHSTFMEDARVKEEIPDAEEFDSIEANQPSIQDDNSSDVDHQQFDNGYSVSPATTLPFTGSSGLVAQILKRVASRTSSNETVTVNRDTPPVCTGPSSSMSEQAGTVGRIQDESTSDEVTVSLLNCKRSRTSSIGSNKQNDLLNFKSWGMMHLNKSIESGPGIEDSSTNKSRDIEIMEVESLPFPRTALQSEQHMYLNTRHLDDAEFIRPSEYLSKEGKISLRYLDVENMLNISPQLRLQMLMCREYKKYTNILLVAMFGRDMLATHSLNGTGTSKPRLDTQKVNHIIEAVMAKFGVNQHHVKEAIRIKLNNEDKLKKRLSQKVSTIVGMQ